MKAKARQWGEREGACGLQDCLVPMVQRCKAQGVSGSGEVPMRGRLVRWRDAQVGQGR